MCTSYFVLTFTSISPAPEVMFNLAFLHRSSLMGTILRATPSKGYTFSTNYNACIAMPAWRRCAPPILFWPWPPYNLLPRSCLASIFFVDPPWWVPWPLYNLFPRLCLTLIYFVDPHWWVPLSVQRPEKAMPFWQIIMYVLQCPHDVHVHLFCFDLDLYKLYLFLLHSCVATFSTSNWGSGTSLLRQELV